MVPLNKHRDFWPRTGQNSSALIFGKIKPSDFQQVAKGLLNSYKKRVHKCHKAGGERRVLNEEEVKETRLLIWPGSKLI